MVNCKLLNNTIILQIITTNHNRHSFHFFFLLWISSQLLQYIYFIVTMFSNGNVYSFDSEVISV